MELQLQHLLDSASWWRMRTRALGKLAWMISIARLEIKLEATEISALTCGEEHSVSVCAGRIYSRA